MSRKNRYETGFHLIAMMQEAKLVLDASGDKGRVEYIKALILSGTRFPMRIVDEVVRVSGRHVREEVEFLLEEGEDEHWGRCPNGELYVIER